MFAQPFDHSFNNDDLFSQYVNIDGSSTDGNKDVSFPSDFDQFFSLDSLSSNCGEQSPIIPTSKQQTHPSPNWAKDLWSLPPDAPSSLGQAPLAFQDTIHPSAVSDLNVNLEASSTTRPAETRSSPTTPPGTPRRKPKSALVTPKSIQRHREPNGRRGHSNNSTVTSSPPSADDIFPSPHSSDPQSMSSWHSDTLGTPGLSFTPDLQSHDAQAWWPPMNARVPQRQHSYQQIVASPPPQQPLQSNPHQQDLANNQHDILQGGLMIQMDPSAYDMTATANSSFSSTTMAPTVSNCQENHTYSHMPAAHPKYVDTSSFATAQLQPQSRSPSLSPRADRSPKDVLAMHHSITMKAQRRQPGRKISSNSMNVPKPVKGFHGSESPKRAGKSVTVSFVNFTPNDSQKILTGVAPSGSSKTKARREQEARDRRRKLSEAALNAVRKAGGDVEALEAALRNPVSCKDNNQASALQVTGYCN
ncbi:hypothetical protein APSETT444_010257 [Aspergillus pseudonomiae]